MKRFKLMSKKVLAALLAGAMVLSVCSCDDWDEDWDDEYEDEDDGNGRNQDNESYTIKNSDITPMQMSVNRDTGEMTINRPVWSGEPMGEEGTWTVFVYICGSDLESDGGSAVNDIYEMCEATSSDDVRFVVQTGGASEWTYDEIDSNKAQRFVVENGDINNVYESRDANMGDPNTLTSFLTWGVNTYPADNMGLILWDHGSGAISGVCFDENHDNDALTLREIDSSLLSAQQYMTEKWEFIGFDACLMGNIEAANIAANYAKYMYGSEEVEPGAGWNYKEIGNFLASDPTVDGAELGRVVCDSFYEGCEETGDYNCCTLSVIDLSKLDNVLTTFNTFAKDIYDQGGDADRLSTMIRKIESSQSFGSNNSSEGYTNMLDLAGLVGSCNDYSSAFNDVYDAIEDAVVYKISGSDHPSACGLSIYFPLCLNGSEELTVFSDVCVSPFYMSFIDRRDYSASIYYSDDADSRDADQDSQYYMDEENGYCYFVENGIDYCYDQNEDVYYQYDESSEDWIEVDGSGYDADQYDYCSSSQANSCYSDDYYYDDNGDWNWNCEYDYDQSTCTYRSMPTQTDRYDYADDFEQTGESEHIKFLRAPSLDEEGVYRFTLTKYSLDHTSDIYATVYMCMEDDEVIELGDTYDIECNWELGAFADAFDGYWLSLPDGQNLATYIVEANDEFVIYTSPIVLNGNETNLRIRQTLDDGTIEVEGTWDGIADSGAAARSITSLKNGDTIVPIYTAFSLDDVDSETVYEGSEFTVEGDFGLVYGLLYEGDFMYAFVIEDVYRDYYLTDFVGLNVDADGNVSIYIEE